MLALGPLPQLPLTSQGRVVYHKDVVGDEVFWRVRPGKIRISGTQPDNAKGPCTELPLTAQPQAPMGPPWVMPRDPKSWIPLRGKEGLLKIAMWEREGECGQGSSDLSLLIALRGPLPSDPDGQGWGQEGQRIWVKDISLYKAWVLRHSLGCVIITHVFSSLNSTSSSSCP